MKSSTLGCRLTGTIDPVLANLFRTERDTRSITTAALLEETILDYVAKQERIKQTRAVERDLIQGMRKLIQLQRESLQLQREVIRLQGVMLRFKR